MDIADLADASIEREREEGLRRLRAATEYTESQLIDGSSGAAVVLCRDCLDPIQPERLNANPRAVRCVDCQLDHERSLAHDARTGL